MLATWPGVLAQVDDIGGALFWSFVVLVLVTGMFFAVRWLRNWLKGGDEEVSTGFTLADLRDLHRQGKMSDEEFEKAKVKMVEATKAAAARAEAARAARAKKGSPDSRP